MKKKKLWIILLIIAVVAIAAAVWYFTPSHFMSRVDANDILYIDIFNGNNGGTYKIKNPEDISYIVDNIQSISFKKSGISVGNKGYRYRMTFFDTKGNVIDRFIINSHDTIRKDPFFYHDESDSLCVDYIEDKMIMDGESEITGPQSFLATVLEETTTYMIVEPAEGEPERDIDKKIRIEYGTDHQDYLFGTGRKVVIYFDGEIHTNDGSMTTIYTDDISTEGFREWSLNVVPAEGAASESSVVPFKKEFNADVNLYYYGVNQVYINVDNKDIPLEDALEKGLITLNAIIAKCNQDVADGVIEELAYKDGGSQVYKYPDYTIIKYHTLDGNRDVYIGNTEMDINVADK